MGMQAAKVGAGVLNAPPLEPFQKAFEGFARTL